MKRLHQKIGVGVLVAGLLLGGVGFSGGSVAHAISIEGNFFRKGVFSREQEEFVDEVNKLGSNELSKLGFNSGRFKVMAFDEKGKLPSLYSGSSIEDIIKFSKYIMPIAHEIQREQPGSSVVKLQSKDSGLEFLIALFKR